MRAEQVVLAVLDAHPPPRWAAFTELAVGTQDGSAPQRLDVWAIDTVAGSHFARRCVEVKVSRGDWRSEMTKPLKRRAGMLVSNEFIFAVPRGLVEAKDCPADCGLWWVDEAGHCEVIVTAPWRETHPTTWAFFAQVAARSQHTARIRVADLSRREKTVARREVLANARSADGAVRDQRDAALRERDEGRREITRLVDEVDVLRATLVTARLEAVVAGQEDT